MYAFFKNNLSCTYVFCVVAIAGKEFAPEADAAICRLLLYEVACLLGGWPMLSAGACPSASSMENWRRERAGDIIGAKSVGLSIVLCCARAGPDSSRRRCALCRETERAGEDFVSGSC